MTSQLRGRNRGRDAEGARKAILAAGEGEFAEHGFSGARIDTIAERSGYNKSLIFHYFGDKLGLYGAVCGSVKAQTQDHFAQRFTALLHDPSAATDRARVCDFIRDSVRYSFDFMHQNPSLRRMLAWEAAEGWQTFTRIQTHDELINRSRGIGDFIRRAQQNGIVRAACDPDMVIAHVLGMSLIYLLSIPRYELIFPGKDFASPDAVIAAREQLVALMLHGTITNNEEP